MSSKIVFLDRGTLPDDHVFRFTFPHEISDYAQTAAADTALRLAGARIAATNKVRISAEDIAANPQLEMIAVCATGCDHIDLAATSAAATNAASLRGISIRDLKANTASPFA